MAKTQKSRKKNFRLRRSVRRTLGALLMITAIVVAAIPFPDAAATGEVVEGGETGTEAVLEAPEYKTAEDTSINDPTVVDLDPTGKTLKEAYTLLNIDGNWWYEWQFKFFTIGTGSTDAIIGQYNRNYKTKNISLKGTINTEYKYVMMDDIETYFTGTAEFDIDKDNYTDPVNQKYFAAACNSVASALAADSTSQPVVVVHPDRDIKDIPMRLEYFCEFGFEGGILKNRGYTMVAAMASSTITASGSGNTNDTIYIPKEKSKNSGDFDGTGYVEDENGFLYPLTEAYLLKGIGEKAFQGVNNVDTISMSEHIQYIGDYAFDQAWVKEVTVANVTEIGNYAFRQCNDLVSFTAENPLRKIGTEAFYNTSLRSITLPTTIKSIGEGAFANNDKLSTIVFKGGSDIEIQKFAFYNCPKLASHDFKDTSIIKIGDGAFALAVLDDGTCSNFVFPEALNDINNFGEGILSGRTELKTVTLPAGLGRSTGNTEELPENTFDGCGKLEVVTFPESCVNLSFGENFFSEVQNPDFFVTGPAKLSANSSDPAMPRKSTWSTSMSNGAPVPYVYTLDGKQYFEISNGDYLLLIDDKGVLASCSFLDTDGDGKADPTEIPEMIIPDKVGNKIITGIAPGCFGDKEDPDSVLNNIIELEISNGSNIKEIGDNVFEGAEKMTRVFIGDSITKIGDRAYADIDTLKSVTVGKNVAQIGEGAFENCVELVDIHFMTPDDSGKLTRDKIGDRAFTTNSNYLTFTGLIEENYGPFSYAMDPDNYVNERDGVRVCYKSGDPTNLTVILDNRNNLPTLMDYPKFEDLDEVVVDILDQEGNPTGETTNLLQKYKDNEVLTPAEEAIINATLFIDIPSGIKSIDTRGYLTNTSPQTVQDQTGKVVTNTMNKSIYFTDNNSYGMKYPYGDTYEEYGLFNGEISDVEVTEEILRGDDNILGITMHTVEYLPTIPNEDLAALGEDDYTGGAFYSCESLQRVDLGSGMTDIGSLPFNNCISLTEVDASKTKDYVSNNKIIYKTITELEDGTPVNGLEIVEVLHTRGLAGDADVNGTADPLLSDVVQIAPGAFMNTKIGTVNLDGTREELKIIPEDCFKNDTGLVETILPANIRIIRDGAFENTADNTVVFIYGKEVDIKNEAFKGNPAIVRTYKDTAAYNAAIGIPNITVRPIDDTYRVVFYNSVNGQIIKSEYVTAGGKAEAPEGDEIPKNTGYKFKGWSSDEYKNVQKDLTIFALYESDGTGSGAGGSGTGGGGTQVPGGSDLDGDGKPDVDANGNKLYELTVTNGTGSGRYAAGTRVSIQAGAAPDGAGFTHWTSTNSDVIFSDATKASTTMTMPAADTTVVSNFAGYYRLDVVYGSGSGSYPAGATVEISAVDAPQGRSFASWKSSTSALKIENSRKQTTTVTMPQSHAKVTATYMDNGTISGNSSGSGSSSNGTKIQITKPGILNTDKASAYVSGSSDGFIVKISESAEATEAVQKALQAKYPDMTRIKYFAMDISLYDATGTRKITNTTGLKINITIPLPEALKEYAGNNKIASVVNGQIEDLAPKFVTIDGVPCISFTATHFSPYTIYVDTANLVVSNTLDATPKTGDGIHPKWFISLGLASLSMILFLKKDKKYVTKLS